MLGLSMETSLTLSGSQSETERRRGCSSILLFNNILEYNTFVKTSAERVLLLCSCLWIAQQIFQLQCATKNRTRWCVPLAVRNSWVPSLLASLARVMVHGSLLFANAPQRFAADTLGFSACHGSRVLIC